MAEPELKHNATIYHVHDWYDAHRMAGDRSTLMLKHAYRLLIHQGNEYHLIKKGFCPTCEQDVPAWRK